MDLSRFRNISNRNIWFVEFAKLINRGFNMHQQDIWENFWAKYKKNIEQETVIKEYHLALKKIIEQFTDKKNVIEIGCGTGITSLILDKDLNKTLVDYDENVIDFARQIFKREEQKATFITADMFKNSLTEKSYDIVFNSGLMEHYEEKSRISALSEFKRILKDDGRIIIAIPNHYCFPYRCGYLLLKLLNKWPYPNEHKIKDFNSELKKLDLEIEQTVICSKNILKDSINNKLLKSLYELLDKVFKFEGYLRVFVIKNPL